MDGWKLWKLPQENVMASELRQAKYYNKHIQDRHLDPGDKILLFLPTHANKLQVTWRGPFLVVEKLS